MPRIWFCPRKPLYRVTYDYKKRNVGHLMGKQESFATELRPGHDHVLRVGDRTIGLEDMWFMGGEGPI